MNDFFKKLLALAKIPPDNCNCTFSIKQESLPMIEIKTPTTTIIITKDEVKQIFINNGFKTKPQKDGSEDLNPYVYEAACALVEFYTERLLESMRTKGS